MIKIEIQDASVNVREFTRKETGELMQFREQTAYAFLSGPYPERITLNLGPQDQPYQPGTYQLDSQSIMVNKYRGLEFARRLKLVLPTKTSMPSFGKPAAAASA